MRRRTRVAASLLLIVCVSIGTSALPDLVVSEISIEPLSPQAGQLVLINATISNNGSSTAQSPFFVHFVVDGREIAIRSISDGITSDRSKHVSAEWLAVAGPHLLSVEVDPPIGRIDESDEANNAEIRTLDVSLSAETQAAIGSLKVVVAPFEDLTGSGFLNVGEGIADKVVDRLSGIGVRVLARSELKFVMQEHDLNPALLANVAMAGRLLGADLLISGSATALEVRRSTLQLGFLSVNGADVDVRLSARLINVYTEETLSVVPVEGHDEGATGFSLDLGGFLALLQTDSPDICGGGLQTTRSWYNVGESIPVAYHNPDDSEWFSIEIATATGSFVRWLGWQYVDTDACAVWNWDQRDAAGFQMSSGVYSAKIWDGTTYVAEVGFQIRPGISLTIPPATEITVGTGQFDQTIVGSALGFAVDDLVAGLVASLQDVSASLKAQRASAQSAEPLIYTRTGQIAAVLPDGRVAINLGASSGVAQGEFFEVLQADNVVVDPQSLEILDYDVLGIKGEIVINEVRERVSFGILTSDFEPAIGDIVRWPTP